ncbi:glycosyltransferase family 2 protein [Lapillicoccus jejuensis]|uniref:Glycosyl transferase family 2 n=1 Tax=Lapillicoccus jejuensis TaxID=402171 RepID=A0A542DZ94_9MICO|nr:glycosyltransferase [Lapillicoccus jejuensis]TQJ08407.1 glycosyl transferase family 2 [Lapillicoccus jejuensis]
MALDILVPYWGDPALLRATVESVLAQRNPDWLLTVVDDAYPDDTASRWLATLDDPRVRYVRQEHNVGITQNYRTCRELATQDVMVFLGYDDLLLPGYVDVVLSAHRRFPDAVVIQPGVEVVDEDGHRVRTLADEVKQRLVRPRADRARVLGGEELVTSLLHGDWMYWPSLAFRTTPLREVDFRDGFPVTQDLALVVDLLVRGGTMVLEPTVCFRYRRHRESASSTALLDGSRFAAERAYFALAAEQARTQGWPRAERAARWRLTSRAHAATLLPAALRSGRQDAVRALVRHALGR